MEHLVQTGEFVALQREILKHKYLYYIKNKPEISDYEYDMLEKKSFEIAKELGFRADSWKGAQENEKHHIHWMVGYKEQETVLYDDCIYKINWEDVKTYIPKLKEDGILIWEEEK